MEITLKLSLEEVNGIIGVLSMLPFNQVSELLVKVRNQAIEQLQAAEAAAQEAQAAEAQDTTDKDAE